MKNEIQNPNTKTARYGSSCVVDPTGLAPVSLRVDGRILLHETTGPGPHKNNIKKRKGPQYCEPFPLDTQI